MPQKKNLNVAPYFDDFDKSKNFHEVLFRPGFAIQARELTQLQSILKNQDEKMGRHLFKEGAMVIPGACKLNKHYYSLKLATQFGGEDVVASQYYNATTPTVITGATTGVKAKVIGYADATSTDQPTLFLEYIGAGTDNVTIYFSDSENLSANTGITHTTAYSSNVASATTHDTVAAAIGCSATITEGVYFIRGTFVEVAEETYVIQKYKKDFTGRVGFKITESIVTPEGDTTLQDNSTGSSNYAAKGAHRLKISVALTHLSETSTSDDDFVELMRVKHSDVVFSVRKSELGHIEETFARRTYDESGNYTVRPFQFEVQESVPNNDRPGAFSVGDSTDDGNTAAEKYIALKVSPGLAYVQGYEIEKIAPSFKDVLKGRDIESVNAGVSTFGIGNYALITKLFGSPDIDFISGEATYGKVIQLQDTLTSTRGAAAGTQIGIARARTIEYNSGTAGATSSNVTSKYKLYLYDIRPFTKITLSGTPSPLPGVGAQIVGVTSGATGYVYDNSGAVINVTNVSGAFVSGEKVTASNSAETDLILENSGNTDLTISSIVINTFADVKQLFMDDADSGQDFTADIDLGATFTLTGTYRTETSGTDNLIGVSGYDTGEVKVGDVLTIPTGTAGATEDRVVDAITATAISFSAAPSTDAITTSNIIRKRAKLYNTEKNLSVVKLPKKTIKTLLTTLNGGASDSQYTFRKQFVATTNSSGVATINAGSNETFGGFAEADYTCSILTAGSGSGAQGDVVTVSGKTSGTGSGTLTITDNTIFGNAAKIKVTTTVLKTAVASKAKTAKLSKAVKVVPGATDAYGTRPTDKTISLGRGDVFKLQAVYDSEVEATDAVAPTLSVGDITGTFVKGEKITGGTSTATGRIMGISSPISYVLTSGNASFAVGETITGESSGATAEITAVTAGDIVVTSRYELDTGQRDNFYDISRIVRKPGQSAPTGRLLIVYDYLEHSTGTYFSVDSYSDIANQMDYEDIPSYAATRSDPDLPAPTGVFPLRDCFDFRPTVADIAGSSTNVDTVDEITGKSFDFTSRVFASTGSATVNWPKPESNVQADFEFYLGKKALVHMDNSGDIHITEGGSAEQPKFPKHPDNMMHLASITIPAFTFSPDDVLVIREKNQRYTMKDIGRLEQRLENVEYYTSLSLLERDAESFQIQDANGLDRFKSGFVVDNFSGHKVGDVQHKDYKIAMDGMSNLARPTYKANGVSLIENATTDAARTTLGYKKTGDLITLPYTEELFTEQPYATRVERLTPVLISQWIGVLELDPPGDEWFETEVAPKLIVNVEGNYDTIVKQEANAIGTIWNAWQTQWSGVVSTSSTSSTSVTTNDVIDTFRTVTRTTNTTRSDLARTGINTQVLEKVEMESQGSKIIARAMVPYVRSRNVAFTGERCYPNTRLYAFFDRQSVSTYVTPDSGYSDGSVAIPTIGSKLITDGAGTVKGTFNIPSPKVKGNPQFETGEVVFRLTSSLNDDRKTQPITAGETTYYAKGILNTEQETVLAIRNAEVVRKNLSETTSVFSTSSNTTTTVRTEGRPERNEPDGDADGGDPLAQTFKMHTQKNTNAAGNIIKETEGYFITSMDLYFFAKEEVIPCWLEIRNTVNGYPGPKVLPFGRVVKKPSEITTSDDASVATTFTFPSPVFVKSDTEYCFVAGSSVPGWKIWISRMGETDIGGSRHVSEQPHLGVMFKGHNNTAWGISLTEDIKFKIRTAKFDIANSGTVRLNNEALPVKELPQNPLVFTNGNTALKVKHRDHHMYSTTNNVTVAGVKSGAETTLNGALSLTATSLTLTSGTSFDDTSGKYSKTAANEWHIKIDDEIMKYTGISGTSVTSITRAQGGTTAAAHANGATVELYQLHKVPLTEVNKTFTAIANIGIDDYTVLLSTSPVIAGSGVAENGGSAVTATENVQYDVAQPTVSTLEPAGTSVSSLIRPTTGVSPSGSQTPFSLTSLANAIVSPLGENYEYSVPQLVASQINETNEMGGAKSLVLDVNLNSSHQNLSPVIDTKRASLFCISNRINNIDSSSDVYPTTDYSASTEPDGDNNAAIYISKRVTLENPATALKIFFSAYRHSTAEIKVLYKILRTDDASDFDELGWTYFNTTGLPDVGTASSLERGDLNEYLFTAGVTDDGIGTALDEFIGFSIKIVMQGTNSAEAPYLKDYRAIALAT